MSINNPNPNLEAPAEAEEHQRMSRNEFRWRLAAGTLVASVAATMVANVSEFVEGVEVGPGPSPDTYTSRIVPGDTHQEPAKIAVQTVRKRLQLDSLQKHAPTFVAADLTKRQQARIDGFVDRLESDSEGVRSVGLTITGRASDEDLLSGRNGDRNLGVPSTDNARLAKARGQLVADVMSRYAKAQNYSNVKIDRVTGQEAIWSKADLKYLNKVGRQYHKTRDELITDYNHSRAGYLDIDAYGLLFFNLTKERGADVRAEVTRNLEPNINACDRVVTEVTTPDHKISELVPGDDGWKVELLPLPGFIPRMPRRRRNSTGSSSKPEQPTDAEPSEPPQSRPERRFQQWQQRETERKTAWQGASERRQTLRIRQITHRDVPDADLRQAEREYQRAYREYVGRSSNEAKKWAAKILIPPAAALLIPIPTIEHETAVNTAPNQECSTFEVEQGSRSKTSLTLLGELIWAKLHDHPWPKHVLDVTTTPTQVEETRSQYTKYTVDKNGKITNKQTIPAYQYPAYLVPPTFKNGE